MTQTTQFFLGIETSCDETAVSVVARHTQKDGTATGDILSNVIGTQFEMLETYGGVVPEIAARAHVEKIDPILRESLKQADVSLQDLTAIAATGGPGLIGGLLVGLTTAKTLAQTLGKPFIAVNHLAGHALTVGLSDQISPPYLLLLVSGGHSQFIFVHDAVTYERIGSTIDDALGEAFDKTAKLLGLGFPGGPYVEQWAAKGDPTRFSLPIPMKGRAEPNFSFSGLKTALRQLAEKQQPIDDQTIADLCAAFQRSVERSVADRLQKALDLCLSKFGAAPRRLVAAGGVAANKALGAALGREAKRADYELIIPPAKLCTDNGAMIAWAGSELYANGITHEVDFKARARWPLDETAAPLLGSGKAGTKA